MTCSPDLEEFSKKQIKNTLDEIRHPIDIAVYGSLNHFNAGAVIRLSHCFLARSVYLVDMPQYYKKASMCTRKYEHIHKVSLDDFLEETKHKNIVAFERNYDIDTEDIRTFQYPESPVLFFGNEQSGCPQEVLDQAFSTVSIPMFGVTNDINISVACGIVLYDYINKLYS